MKILIAGSSGLVGTALVESLGGQGHTVCQLLRPESAAKAGGARPSVAVRWDPGTGELEGAAAGADALVNLAGVSIASGRWTAGRKRALYSSRVDTTRALVKAAGQLHPRPRVLVSASAVGYYGSCGDEE
ncbi:MAG TPA: NAD-dependent epimerase/dehydratase family protein, partial [Candidatus Acidoferrales bacterium]